MQVFKPLAVHPILRPAGVQEILLTAGVQAAGCVSRLIVSRVFGSMTVSSLRAVYPVLLAASV